METVRQPGAQTRFGRFKIHTSDANLGESEFLAPSLNLGNHLTAIETRAGVVHPPIVKTLVWIDEDATRAFAGRLAAQPALRDCYIELHGELGAGKTSLVRHLLHALGVHGRVKSPTYAVVESYTLGSTPTGAPALQIWHCDFYRFDDPAEWEDAGFREIFSGPGLKIAEWPDKAAGFAPRADLVLRITVHADGVRQLTLAGQTARGDQLLEAVAP